MSANPFDSVDESEVEILTIKPQYVPDIVRENPHLFDMEDMPEFLNEEHYHYVHCPYGAEYIRNSSPPTFHLRCKYNDSQIGWSGKCVQIMETKDDLIRGMPNKTVDVYKTCRFVHL